ncbi:MAG: hypothetical protein HY978_00730 [Candidatus Liptonbacteria bacterium]|nr:hypothetical protein [Candidatus Liptonbacteria bacterium]
MRKKIRKFFRALRWEVRAHGWKEAAWRAARRLCDWWIIFQASRTAQKQLARVRPLMSRGEIWYAFGAYPEVLHLTLRIRLLEGRCHRSRRLAGVGRLRREVLRLAARVDRLEHRVEEILAAGDITPERRECLEALVDLAERKLVRFIHGAAARRFLLAAAQKINGT